MYAVITRVQVDEGSIDELAALFDQTNRDLVSVHEDWLSAIFTANRETSEVTVIARWTDADSYDRLRSSPEFAAVMGRFSQRFVGPPSVSMFEVLVEM